MSDKFDYLVESERTLSGKFYGSEVKALHIRQLLINFSNSACLLDKVKKGVFYGKEVEQLPRGGFNFSIGAETKDIFHAIIGIATEAGELAEAYLKTWNDHIPGKNIDVVNLCEEIGDIFWYAAIIAREAGVSFEDIQRNNIEKLAKRFPDKFTEFNANNRDLAGEREILEGIHKQGENLSIGSFYSGPDFTYRPEIKTSDSVELPQSIEPEVACISKAKLIEAFEAMHKMAPVVGIETPEQVAEYIFKNYA